MNGSLLNAFTSNTVLPVVSPTAPTGVIGLISSGINLAGQIIAQRGVQPQQPAQYTAAQFPVGGPMLPGVIQPAPGSEMERARLEMEQRIFGIQSGVVVRQGEQCFTDGYRITASGRRLGPYKVVKGRCKLMRKMNPLNPRALRRSASRLGSFVNFARRAEKELSRLGNRAAGPSRRSRTAGCGTCGKRKCSC